jgi:hypothetical protein
MHNFWSFTIIIPCWFYLLHYKPPLHNTPSLKCQTFRMQLRYEISTRRQFKMANQSKVQIKTHIYMVSTHNF